MRPIIGWGCYYQPVAPERTRWRGQFEETFVVEMLSFRLVLCG